MTGFGLAEVHNEKLHLTIQVKSVNGRFLESRFRLPRDYQALEIEMKKILNEFFSRGTVDVHVSRTLGETASNSEVRVNTGLAQSWIKAYQALGKTLGLTADVSLPMVIHVPGVMQVEEGGTVEEVEKAVVLKSFREACKACLEEREREGRSVAKTLHALLDELGEFVLFVQKHRKELNDKFKKKLTDRLKDLDAEVNVDENRMAQEVLFAIERSDVEEEVERALAHIKSYKKQLTIKDAAGKKLEFYTQELHREVNTMGSKSNDLGLTENVIQAKAVVERLREQVQNVE